MSEKEITLKDVFPALAPAPAKDVLAAAAANGPLRQLQANVLQQANGIQWPWVLKEVWGRIPELLDVKLVHVFSGAFNKAKELKKYCDPEKYPPGQVILTHLAEHTVRTDHHPYVEVFVNDRSMGKFAFEVAVAFTFKGLVLKIQDAKVKTISPGSCQAKGIISLEQAILVERNLSPLTLPAFIDLGEGINLRG